MRQQYNITTNHNCTTSLLDMLRAATHEIHERLHIHPLTKPLTEATLTLKHYCHVLSTFYGYYAPNAVHSKHAAWRTKWLEQDLKYFGIEINNLTLCFDLPSLKHPTEQLGYLYVTEGSSLGSKVISKHLKGSIGVTSQTGGQYFYGYGQETGLRWRNNKVLLESQAPQLHVGIVMSAEQSFACLERWLTLCYERDTHD